MFGMQEIYNVCLSVGVLVMFNTLLLWVITFPKCTGGAPYVLLALLLGTGNCSGVSGGVDVTVESVGVGNCELCWFICGSNEVSVSKNTLLDA